MNCENTVAVIRTQYFKSLRFFKLSEGNKWPWTPRNEIRRFILIKDVSNLLGLFDKYNHFSGNESQQFKDLCL